MDTIALTPEVLRALALGLDRLNDGCSNDRATALAAQAQIIKAGWVVDNGWCRPVEDACEGYINGQYARFNGTWNIPVKSGDVLTFDEEGTLPLRILQVP